MAALFDALELLPLRINEVVGAELSGVRLFSTLLYVYVLAIVQRLVLTGANANLHHIYHTITSAILLYYNFGIYSGYFIANIVIVYLLILMLGPSKYMIILSFIINLGCVGIGYIQQSMMRSAIYIIIWTTPHCVLTLKLIGLTWDVYDGAQKDKKGKEETALASVPSFLKVLGFCYYSPALFTGPQISFNKYTKFTEGLFDRHLSSGWIYGFMRLLAGVVLVVSYPLLSPYFSTQYFYTDEFKNTWFGYKFVFITIWGQIVLSRYVGVWLIAEGSCVLSGIAYNGVDEAGRVRWDGSANMNLTKYFSATSLHQFVESFNMNTNKWVLTYVYKRLKFLNNRHISQGAALLFLAAWHGVESGYFVCFAFEFLSMNGERLVSEVCAKKKILKTIVNHPILSVIIPIFTKIFATFCLSYALISFEVKNFDKYMLIYSQTNYSAYIFYGLLCPLVCALLSAVLENDKPVEKIP